MKLDRIKHSLLRADHRMSGWLSPWHIREDMRYLVGELEALCEAARAVDEEADAGSNFNLPDSYVVVKTELMDRLAEQLEEME